MEQHTKWENYQNNAQSKINNYKGIENNNKIQSNTENGQKTHNVTKKSKSFSIYASIPPEELSNQNRFFNAELSR